MLSPSLCSRCPGLHGGCSLAVSRFLGLCRLALWAMCSGFHFAGSLGAPNCCFGNLFLGAVCGGTGRCSSLTSWSVRGAGWFCLWTLDLVETILLTLPGLRIRGWRRELQVPGGGSGGRLVTVEMVAEEKPPSTPQAAPVHPEVPPMSQAQITRSRLPDMSPSGADCDSLPVATKKAT
ncbi:hypothetical protein Taro_046135, partial [Colocasia esculenta]|nr:hypothetical protein [Colocasia esculenta]